MHFSNNFFIKIIPVQIILLSAVITADYLNRKHHFFKVSFIYVLFDELMHVAHYSAVMLPLISRPFYFLIGAASGVLIDVDHFFAARSANVKDLVSMESRPAFHSMLAVSVISASAYLISRDLLLAGALFAGMAMHLLRDLIEGKTYILYPSKSVTSLPFAGYISLSLIFSAAAFIIIFSTS